MRILLQVNTEVKNKYDIFSVYQSLMISLIETSKHTELTPDEFFMMVNAANIAWMDNEFKYLDVDQHIKHMSKFIRKHWEAKADENPWKI